MEMKFGKEPYEILLGLLGINNFFGFRSSNFSILLPYIAELEAFAFF